MLIACIAANRQLRFDIILSAYSVYFNPIHIINCYKTPQREGSLDLWPFFSMLKLALQKPPKAINGTLKRARSRTALSP